MVASFTLQAPERLPPPSSRNDEVPELAGVVAVQWKSRMKKIEAIIRPSKVDPVRTALQMRGVEPFELFEAAGYGSEPRPVVAYRGALDVVPPIPKVKLEVVVNDALAMPLRYDIVDAARTGRVGDGPS